MTPELKNLIIERYTSWTETWGLSLGFAVTQSLEKSERTIADAIVALIAIEAEQEAEFGPETTTAAGKNKRGPQLPSSVSPVRFAKTIWELASKQAYRGFGVDPFFRMPAVARAIVVLKIKAQLSRQQIAIVLNIKPAQIDDHLENARLLHSDGRPWLGASPNVQLDDQRSAYDVTSGWNPVCPQWVGMAPRSDSAVPNLQDVFAHYVGNDLAPDEGRKLHSHLMVCATCRTSFAFFKKQYADWSNSIPAVETDQDLRRHLKKITNMALKVRRKSSPRFLPGVRRVMSEAQVKAILIGAASLGILHLILTNKH